MHVVCKTDSIRSVLEIVVETDLIQTMPRATSKPYLEEDRLEFLSPDYPQSHRPLGVIKRVDAPENPVTDRFLAMLTQGMSHGCGSRGGVASGQSIAGRRCDARSLAVRR
jgi:DNA-binding transcriptional LysR family regulator